MLALRLADEIKVQVVVHSVIDGARREASAQGRERHQVIGFKVLEQFLFVVHVVLRHYVLIIPLNSELESGTVNREVGIVLRAW